MRIGHQLTSHHTENPTNKKLSLMLSSGRNFWILGSCSHANTFDKKNSNENWFLIWRYRDILNFILFSKIISNYHWLLIENLPSCWYWEVEFSSVHRLRKNCIMDLGFILLYEKNIYYLQSYPILMHGECRTMCALWAEPAFLKSNFIDRHYIINHLVSIS